MGFRRWGGLVAGKLGPDKATSQESPSGLESLHDGCQVSREQFNDLLRTIDKGLRALPATGQVLARGTRVQGACVVLCTHACQCR